MTDTKPKYTLTNGEEHYAKHPDTFWMPERKAREALKPGDKVQCMFIPLDGNGGDRMWVTVQAVREDGKYLGKLENCPFDIDAELGDDVVFGPEHIIDIKADDATAMGTRH